MVPRHKTLRCCDCVSAFVGTFNMVSVQMKRGSGGSYLLCFLVLFLLKKSSTAAATVEEGWCEASKDDTVMFDYIIVGAGPGGGVVASRLTQAGYKTLLLDAGPEYDNSMTRVPIFWPLSTEDVEIEWRFNSSNSKVDEGRDQVLYPRASGIGGCAIHNAMVAMYSFPDTWEKLRKLTGDNEYAEKKMRKRFVRIEKNEYAFGKAPGHGSNGWMSTSLVDLRLIADPQFFDPQLAKTVSAFLSNGLSKGIPLIADVNGLGKQSFQHTHLIATSVSKSKGFIRSSVLDLIQDTAANHDNLVIKPNSFVKKILLSDVGGTKTAIGVQVQEGKCLYEVATCTKTSGSTVNYFAKKEIILAGGVFNTPQTLMLSGIGPTEQLDQFGIPVEVDLPGVGSNLQDKLEVNMNFRVKKNWRLLEQACTFGRPSPQDDPCLTAFNNQEFPSIYSTPGTFLSMQQNSSPDVDYPNMYIQLTTYEFRGYNPGWVDLGLFEDIKDVLTFNLQTPRYGPSTGTVKLKSTDPLEKVEIDFNGYDQDELDRTAKVVFQLREFAKKLEKLGVVEEEFFPGPDLQTMDEIKSWIRANGWGHHPIGTAKMGRNSDEMAVVNGQFQVRRVNNLRIVDASVFPDQPGFFPMVPLYMLAEKAAEDIMNANLDISPEDIGCSL